MITLKNVFFDLALKQALRMVGKPARMVRLLGQLTLKLQHLNSSSINAPALKEKFLLLGRMLKAHVSGQYKARSLRFLLILLAAVIYLINPLDLVPDFILGIGLTDDLAVVTWVYQALAGELKAFAEWENTKKIPNS